MSDQRALKTSRLRLEPLALHHLVDYSRLIEQPAVHRYLSRSTEIAANPAGQAERIVRISEEQWRVRGYGPFAIFENGGAALIGRGGLFWIESLQDVEINYMFDPKAWGRGYATEAATKFLAIGFGQHALVRIVATTNPDNAASAEVLRKVGMSRAGQRDLGDGRIVDYHEITREVWVQSSKAGL